MSLNCSIIIGKIGLLGIFVPIIWVLMLLAWPLTLILRKLVDHWGIYRFVWYHSLFDLAIYIVLLGFLTYVSLC